MKNKWLPICIVILGLGASFYFYQAILQEEEHFIHQILKKDSNQAAVLIKNALRARVTTLKRMGARWEKTGGTPQSEWLEDAENYYQDDPGYQALEWVDKNYYVRWIYPLKGNERAQDLNLAFEEKRRQALERAREKRTLTMTRPVDLVQGGKGFLTYFPLYVENNFEGFILAVFRFDTLLKEVFKDQFDKYEIILNEQEEVIYSSTTNELAKDRWSEKESFEVYGHTWSVVLKLKKPELALLQPKMPQVALIVGILLTLLITSLIISIDKTNAAKDDALAQESRFKLAVRGTNDGIWDWFDVTKDDQYWSPRFYELLGYEDDEIPATFASFKSLLHPDDMEQARQAMDRHLKDKELYQIEYRLKRKEGDYRWFLGRGTSTFIKSTGLTRMAGSISDIHEKKTAGLALQEKNEELEQLNSMMLGRELRMIELKKEINDLSQQLGKSPPFDLDGLDQQTS